MNNKHRILAGILAALLLAGCSKGILVKPTVPQNTQAAESIPHTQPVTSEPPQTAAPTESTAATTPTETVAPPQPAQTVPTDPTVPETTAAPKPQRHDPYDVEKYAVSPQEQALLDAVCAMRVKEGLGQLSVDGRLCALAYLRSYEMSLSFSHNRPDGSDFASVFRDYGYPATVSEEVALKGDEGHPAEYILEDWLHSVTTKKPLLQSGFTHVGVGIYEKDGSLYAVCLLTAK